LCLVVHTEADQDWLTDLESGTRDLNRLTHGQHGFVDRQAGFQGNGYGIGAGCTLSPWGTSGTGISGFTGVARETSKARITLWPLHPLRSGVARVARETG
jgi:hypothetical protein